MFGDGLFAPCRVVWRSHRSDAARSDPDWALIRIDHDFAAPCAWSDHHPPAPGDVVIAGADGGTPSFGRIAIVWPHEAGDVRNAIVGHTAPIDAGDSGGATSANYTTGGTSTAMCGTPPWPRQCRSAWRSPAMRTARCATPPALCRRLPGSRIVRNARRIRAIPDGGPMRSVIAFLALSLVVGAALGTAALPGAPSW